LTTAVHGAFDTAYLTTLAVDSVLLLFVAFKAWRTGAERGEQLHS
jgi:hypothetical protein